MGASLNRFYDTPLLLIARLIRLPNLLLVALTQFLINYSVIHPGIDAMMTATLFHHSHFYLLLAVTLLITASGYIINDIHDVPADEINKPEKQIVNKHISFSTAYWLYFCCCISGYLLALYLAFYVERLPYINIYLLAVGALYAYSAYFKKKPLIGNFIVALLCAGVAAILILAEYEALAFAGSINPLYYWHVLTIVGAYAVFAFLSTLFREIVKDLEDIEGDAQTDYHTAPVAWGVNATKKTAMFSGLLWVVALMVCWWIPDLRKVVWMGIPVTALLFFLYRANSKRDYSRISFYCKWVMLGGLFILL